MSKSPWFESLAFGLTSALSLVLLITGIMEYTLGHWLVAQIASLLHPAAGMLLTITLMPYLVVHFRRIYGIRRFSTFASGLLSSLLMLAMLISGWQLIMSGETSVSRALLNIHIGCSSLFVIGIIAHLYLHWRTWSSRRNAEAGRFVTLGKLMPVSAYISAVVLLMFVLLLTLDHVTEEPYKTTPVVENYQWLYGEHPFRPSQTETPNQQFIDQRAIVTTEKCVNCHAEIVAQWRSSVHRQAASDKTYVTNVTLLASKKGIAATRYCEGCHAPVALLTGQLSEGGEHGGIVGTPGNVEGVNCQSCHGIKRLIHTKGVASYEFVINQPYLFETAGAPFLQQLNRLAMFYGSDQHKQDMAPEVLGTSQYCASCHAQFMDKDVNNWGWVKMQDEFSAWLNSPFAGTNDPRFAHANQQRCQDCHMPLVKARDPAADPQGMVRDHRFVAANTMLTTIAGDHAMADAIERFMQSNKVRISIEPPHRNDATVNSMPVREETRMAAIQPFYFYKGEQAELNIVVANVGVGHDFPGGTIDINQAWVAVQVVDAEGNTVFESGALDAEGYVDTEAYIYRSLPVDRHGDLVWRHDLFNMVGKTSVNVVKAGESDVINYKFDVPHWAKGPLSVAAQVKYRKLNTRYAKWAMKEQYQPLPVIDVSRAQLLIPIRSHKETTPSAVITLSD